MRVHGHHRAVRVAAAAWSSHTGSQTAFGGIALRLGERHREQPRSSTGSPSFSQMIATITACLAGSIFVINVMLGRSVLQSALFALAIAVGLAPSSCPPSLRSALPPAAAVSPSET